ncbi:MAG: CPXCG motif-containing cysteine-rich protein [Halorhodospira sp.]
MPGTVPEVRAACPCCGEPFTLRVDTGGADAAYVEDCPVCCAPIDVLVRWPLEAEAPVVELRGANT